MKVLYVELANNHIKRECGLMHRKRLGKNNGMLFKFPYSTRLSFWMKNTYIPLDIAYLNEDGKIIQIESMVPLSTKAVVSKNNCQYALEVNKGWFKENNISIGNKVVGHGFDIIRRAQNVPQENQGAQEQTQQPQQTQQPPPEVMLQKSIEETLLDGDRNNKKFTIIYQKEDGFILPPKTISPPYDIVTVRRKSDGETHKEINCWDEQEGDWKTFFIDNILSIQPVEIT